MHAATALADSTAFLYSGPNPIQTGVAPGTIDIRRAAVVRGIVQDADGNGLGAVAVSIFNHPELGSTLSRMDGKYDLAVNGGGDLNVVYARDGYHPAQRLVSVPWQDYVFAQPVRLLAFDSRVTMADLVLRRHDALLQVYIVGTALDLVIDWMAIGFQVVGLHIEAALWRHLLLGCSNRRVAAPNADAHTLRSPREARQRSPAPDRAPVTHQGGLQAAIAFPDPEAELLRPVFKADLPEC